MVTYVLLGNVVWAETSGRLGPTTFGEHVPFLFVLLVQHENVLYLCALRLFHDMV